MTLACLPHQTIASTLYLGFQSLQTSFLCSLKDTWQCPCDSFCLAYFPLSLHYLFRDSLSKLQTSLIINSFMRTFLTFLFGHDITYLCCCCFLCTLHLLELNCCLFKPLFPIKWTFLKAGLISYFNVFIKYSV